MPLPLAFALSLRLSPPYSFIIILYPPYLFTPSLPFISDIISDFNSIGCVCKAWNTWQPETLYSLYAYAYHCPSFFGKFPNFLRQIYTYKPINCLWVRKKCNKPTSLIQVEEPSIIPYLAHFTSLKTLDLEISEDLAVTALPPNLKRLEICWDVTLEPKNTDQLSSMEGKGKYES